MTDSHLLSRREFLRAAGLALAVAPAALAACTAPPPTPTTRASGPVQLVYRDWRTDWFPPMAQRLLDEFHATHPNIRVYYNLDPENNEFEEKSLADLQAGTAPDVFQGCCSFLPIWAQKGFLLDLRPYVAADLDRATIDDWDPVQYKSFFARDGRQYALPKYHGALALYFNKDLFDMAHVDYPTDAWTHDDYLDAMRRIARWRTGSGKPAAWGSMLDLSWERLQVHVNDWGGHFVDPQDPTKSRLADREALEALEWIRARMWNDKVMATPLDVQNKMTQEAFAAGQLAMVEDGSWNLKQILTDAKFPVGLAPMPAGPVRRATLATTDGFGIYAGTKYPEAAWELLKFLISPEYGRAMARTNLLQPARASLVNDWAGYVRAEFPEKTRDLDIAAFAEGHLQGYSVIAETALNMTAAMEIASGAWEQLLTLGKAPVEIIKTASRQIDEAQQKK